MQKRVFLRSYFISQRNYYNKEYAPERSQWKPPLKKAAVTLSIFLWHNIKTKVITNIKVKSTGYWQP